MYRIRIEVDIVARSLSLQSDYDPFVQVVRLYVDEVLLRRLFGAIQVEALRMKTKTTKPKAVNVLNATKALKRGKSKLYIKEVKCYNCGTSRASVESQ
jgi:hypothetical protein